MSKIEWTDETWNPVVGCSLASPGCTHCYAMPMAARLAAMGIDHYAGLTQPSKAGPVWTGKVALAPESILTKPLRWNRPRRVFVNSMGDLFHEDVPNDWIDRVFAVMALCPRHTFQVLTKRSARMRAYMTANTVRDSALAAQSPWPLPNVWLGVSAEDQARADARIPDLLDTPAAVRFVSAEPLLGPVDLTDLDPTGTQRPRKANGISAIWKGNHIGRACLDWVIVGGESGPGARPMHPDWARSIRDQCAAAAVPFFFKQWGEWAPHRQVAGGDLGGDVRAGRVRFVHPTGQSDVEVSDVTGGRSTIPGSRFVARVGKRRAGRCLDGREWNEFPAGERSTP